MQRVGPRSDRLGLDFGGLCGPQDELARDHAFDVSLERDLVHEAQATIGMGRHDQLSRELTVAVAEQSVALGRGDANTMG